MVFPELSVTFVLGTVTVVVSGMFVFRGTVTVGAGCVGVLVVPVGTVGVDGIYVVVVGTVLPVEVTGVPPPIPPVTGE
jgi:hypothetical protein